MDSENREKMNSIKKYAILFWEFFKVGIFTIGGGIAMIPQIQQVVVEDKKWISEEDMLDCIAVAQSLPGVVAINSATYIGNRMYGIKGALAATLGVVAPSFIIIIVVVSFLGAIGENSYILGAFTGIKAAVCGLIMVTAVKLAKQSLTNVFQWILAAAAFAAIAAFGVTAVWAVLGGAVLGIIYNSVKMRRLADDKTAGGSAACKDDAEDDEAAGCMEAHDSSAACGDGVKDKADEADKKREDEEAVK